MNMFTDMAITKVVAFIITLVHVRAQEVTFGSYTNFVIL